MSRHPWPPTQASVAVQTSPSQRPAAAVVVVGDAVVVVAAAVVVVAAAVVVVAAAVVVVAAAVVVVVAAAVVVVVAVQCPAIGIGPSSTPSHVAPSQQSELS